jgi:hypothetical protein
LRCASEAVCREPGAVRVLAPRVWRARVLIRIARCLLAWARPPLCVRWLGCPSGCVCARAGEVLVVDLIHSVGSLYPLGSDAANRCADARPPARLPSGCLADSVRARLAERGQVRWPRRTRW